jgi:hypothetical protein
MKTKFTNADVIAACRTAGRATEKVTVILRGRMDGLDADARLGVYVALCKDAMIVKGIKHTKDEMRALSDRGMIRGYDALVSAWRAYNKAPSTGPRTVSTLSESLAKSLGDLVERIQKAKPERITFDAPREIAALQAAMVILKK